MATDAIRGLSFCVVFLAHTAAEGLRTEWLDFSGAGKAGVWLFFCLSALLIGLRLQWLNQSGLPTARRVSGFLAGRFVRLLGPYFTLLLLLWLFNIFQTATFVQHLALLEGRGVFWSISPEVQFYLLAPCLMACLGMPWFRRALLIAITAVALANLWVPADLALLSLSERLPIVYHWLPFACGALLAVRFCQAPPAPDWKPLLPIASAAFVGVSLLLKSGYWTQSSQTVRALTLCALALAATWLCVSALASDRARDQSSAHHDDAPMLLWRCLATIGRFSYSLYLTHMIAVRLVTAHTPLEGGLGLLVAIVLAGLIGFAFHRLAERPFETLGKRIASQITGLAASPLWLTEARHPRTH